MFGALTGCLHGTARVQGHRAQAADTSSFSASALAVTAETEKQERSAALARLKRVAALKKEELNS